MHTDFTSIYGRVSTDSQEENGSSLPYQMNKCLEFAKENGLKIGKKSNGDDAIFLESYSGAYYDRPLLSELLSLVKEGRISSVIFTKRDRVARDQYTFQRIKKEIEEAGGKMYFAEEKLTGDIAIDSFMGSTIVGFAEWERIQIQRRTHSGKVQHARENKWGFSFVPYGYTKNPETKKLELFPDESKVVKEVFRLYLEEGYTLDGIARHLDHENIPPPSLSSKGTKNQKSIADSRKNASGKWIASTVYRILERGELYSGSYTAFKEQYKKVGDKSIHIGMRDESEWITIEVPSIISEAEGEQAKEKLEMNRRFAKKRSKRSYLLRGKLMCDCETPHHHMVGYTGQKAKRGKDKKTLKDAEGNTLKDYYTNYRCVLFDGAKASTERRCKNHISGLKIEKVVIDTIKELFLNPETLFDYANSSQLFGENQESLGNKSASEVHEKDTSGGSEYEDHDYHELIRKFEAIMKKNERIEELFVDGMISKDRVKEMKLSVNEEEEKLKKALEREERLLRQEAFTTSARKNWEEIRGEIGKMMHAFFLSATDEEIQEVIQLLVERVVVSHHEKKHVIVEFKIPLDYALMDRYMEDQDMTWMDDEGKNHTIGSAHLPRIFPLSEGSEPLKSKEVGFDTKKRKKESKEDNKKHDNDRKGGGKGGGSGNGGSSTLSNAFGKMVGYLKGKYSQHCRLHHEKSKISFKKGDFYFSIMSESGARNRSDPDEVGVG